MPLHPVLDPVRVGALTLANRAALAPLSRVSTAGDGVPTERMARYYADFARGGFGLIISEGTYPDTALSQAYRDQPGIATAEQAEGWRAVTEAVHRSGGRIFCQLMHAGALSQHLADTIAPSVVQPKGEKMPDYVGQGPYPLPKAMEETEIERTIAGFAAAARRAREAGFDGVEIHGANGYLIDQFLTPYTNLRTDRWGGDAAARARFGAEIVRRVRHAMPAEFAVGIRLSQGKVNDHRWRWPGGREDGEAFFAAVAEAGADYLHIASEGGGYFESGDLGGTTVAALARKVSGKPVIANGGLQDPILARRVLEEGHGDLISLGRGALANPDWPARLAQGRLLHSAQS